jgi:hypothetical protein
MSVHFHGRAAYWRLAIGVMSLGWRNPAAGVLVSASPLADSERRQQPPDAGSYWRDSTIRLDSATTLKGSLGRF